MKHATDYLTFETPHRRDYLNITARVEAFVHESGIQHGLCLINPMHITAAIYVNDDESGLIADDEAGTSHSSAADLHASLSTLGLGTHGTRTQSPQSDSAARVVSQDTGPSPPPSSASSQAGTPTRPRASAPALLADSEGEVDGRSPQRKSGTPRARRQHGHSHHSSSHHSSPGPRLHSPQHALPAQGSPQFGVGRSHSLPGQVIAPPPLLHGYPPPMPYGAYPAYQPYYPPYQPVYGYAPYAGPPQHVLPPHMVPAHVAPVSPRGSVGTPSPHASPARTPRPKPPGHTLPPPDMLPNK